MLILAGIVTHACNPTYSPVIPADWEAEAWESQIWEQFSEIVSE